MKVTYVFLSSDMPSSVGKHFYAFASDDTQPLTRIRLGLKGWRTGGGSSFALADEPREHYDFNF